MDITLNNMLLVPFSSIWAFSALKFKCDLSAFQAHQSFRELYAAYKATDGGEGFEFQWGSGHENNRGLATILNKSAICHKFRE
ncbi:hypothetical protein BGC07_17220 [Piscirickettsia litoralis]|uniref:Uncharacterized protein n=1 Tax=Piscirickettsia litoralis TaxID=1891921 RepID=A0ABX2ZY47_9GAMM|nr:hypothetical protein BGC07_17220 [Piscirickettsia litoralis]